MTKRQIQILTEIIRKYADRAEPVGSLSLAEHFNLSPATIRYEMAELEHLGLISQPHTSSGRIPTDKGYRFYVNNLSGVQPKSRSAETINKRVDSLKDKSEKAIKIAAETLSDLTGNMALATLDENVYFYGYNQLFSQPELSDTFHTQLAARFLDSLQDWLSHSFTDDNLNIFIGHENPIVKSSGLTMILSRFNSPLSESNYIGIVGSTRQSYERVISLVDYAGKKLEKVINK
ncbi:MAG: transcriptional regulator [bacterium]|nr:transcriptional regulator [bacterium]